MKLSSPIISSKSAVAGLHSRMGNAPEDIFFAAYTGSSMNPALREPEVMEILPYNNKPLRIGDVVFFLPPESTQAVVHRIICITAEGMSTLGDNNTLADPYLIQPGNIKGRVVAAWRGQKRRKIAGGWTGRLASRRFRWRGILDRGVSPLLHPIYQTLSHWKLIQWILPASLRTRIVVFRFRDKDQFQLLLGKRIIGRYDEDMQKWLIQRPFQLFVAGGAILDQQVRDKLDLQVLNECQRTMNHSLAQETSYRLVLVDGTHWEITAGNEDAVPIVSKLAYAMQLSAPLDAIEPPRHGNLRKLFVHVDEHITLGSSYVPLASENNSGVACILSPCNKWGGSNVNLMRLSLVFAREAQARGGVLIHGALAERDGFGVILAAPGGTGKTTASNRFPTTWHSLCDDATLVVQDSQGNYMAHPWPTWSRFMDGGPGGSWEVQKAVPLKGIFILDRAVDDRAEHLGSGHAVSLLVESVAQASLFMWPGLVKEEISALNLERFNNLCALVRVIPVHVLHISLTGAFWKQIEQELKIYDK